MSRIAQLAEIRSGYTFRRLRADQPRREYPVLQIGDIRDDGTLDTSALKNMTLGEVAPHHFVQPGDVLFSARGARNVAALCRTPLEDTVAGSQFFILRVRHPALNPAYLACYLNRAPAQRYLARHINEGRLPMVTKEILAELPVPLPTPEVQERLVELDTALRREQALLQELKTERARLAHALWVRAAEEHAGSPP